MTTAAPGSLNWGDIVLPKDLLGLSMDRLSVYD